MTQIVAVSADAAALNIESIKLQRRVSVKDKVADARIEADRYQRIAEGVSDPDAVEMTVAASSVALDLLAGGHHPQQQASLSQVEAAYRELDDEEEE